jgi:hypothetical protein
MKINPIFYRQFAQLLILLSTCSVSIRAQGKTADPMDTGTALRNYEGCMSPDPKENRIEACRASIQAGLPQNKAAEAHWMMGCIYLKKPLLPHEYSQASAEFKTAIELGRNSTSGLLFLAVAQDLAGYQSEAGKTYRDILKRDDPAIEWEKFSQSLEGYFKTFVIQLVAERKAILAAEAPAQKVTTKAKAAKP